jgi:hypothetical protein
MYEPRLPRTLLYGLAVLLYTFVAAGCGGDDAPMTSPSEFAASPEQFFGEEVTIESEVSNPIDHRVWEVADGRVFVIYDRGLDRGLEQGERLRVSGTVQRLERGTIEGELGMDIEDHFYAEAFLDDDVVLVADDVARLGG